MLVHDVPRIHVIDHPEQRRPGARLSVGDCPHRRREAPICRQKRVVEDERSLPCRSVHLWRHEVAPTNGEEEIHALLAPHALMSGRADLTRRDEAAAPRFGEGSDGVHEERLARLLGKGEHEQLRVGKNLRDTLETA